MRLSGYQRVSYKVFGRVARRGMQSNPQLSSALLRANIPIRPDAFLATAYMGMLTGFAFGLGMALLVFGIFFSGLVELPVFALVIVAPLPAAIPLVIYVVTMLGPELQANQRAKKIDAHLPFAVSYLSILTAAGVTPAKAFRSLSEQAIYGEVATEAGLISRDLNILGSDVVKAFSDAGDRTPSVRMQNLLQGAVTALTSGVEIRDYFLGKAEQFFYENRQEQRQFLENLGIMAESFVTVVVAGPTFLLVLLSIMANVGAQATGSLISGYVLMLVIVPLAQLAFALTILSSTPEV